MFPSFHSFEEYKKTIQFSISPYSFSLHSLHFQNQMVITNQVVEHPMSSVPFAGPTATTIWEDLIGTDRDNAMRIEQNAGGCTGALAAGQQYQFHGSGNAAENVRSGNFGGGNGGVGLVPQHPFQPLDGFDGGVCKEGGGRNQQKQRTENGVDALTSADKKRKRMIKNRASAARSRARKQAYTTQLEIEVAQLQKENELLRKRKKFLKMLDLESLQNPARWRQRPFQQHSRSCDDDTTLHIERYDLNGHR